MKYTKTELRIAFLAGRQANKMGHTPHQNIYTHDESLEAEWLLGFFLEDGNKYLKKPMIRLGKHTSLHNGALTQTWIMDRKDGFRLAIEAMKQGGKA